MKKVRLDYSGSNIFQRFKLCKIKTLEYYTKWTFGIKHIRHKRQLGAKNLAVFSYKSYWKYLTLNHCFHPRLAFCKLKPIRF